MLNTTRKLWNLLSPEERRHAILLLLMILLMAILDMIGVASIMPFMAVLANPDIVDKNQYLSAAYRTLGFSNVRDFLYFLGIVFFVAFIGSSAFKALTTKALLHFTYMRDYSLGRRLVAGYLHQPYDWFLNRHSADLGKTVLSEVAEVIIRALIPMMQLIAHGAVVLGLLILLILVDPLLATLLVVGLGSGYAITYLLLRRYLGRIGVDRLNANRERFKILQEAFGGIKDVKVSGLEETLLERFDGPAKRFARRHTASQVVNQLPRFALEAIAFGGMLLLVLYLMSASRDLQQILPVLALYAFVGYRLIPALQQIYVQLANLRFSGPALDQLHSDLIQLESSVSGQRKHQSSDPVTLSHCLKLDNVTYTYPNSDRAALTNLTLQIDALTTVGLVGITGSGKSTTVDVILGLLRPQSGRLLADNMAITPTNVRAWQRAVGYVPQQIFVADDTVAANIAFGVPPKEIDYGAVERAARVANLHEFIVQEMPNRYATEVGERGVRLSGGQRQRIGIARALYHDPQVLIMDEATSALDGITEQAVMEAVHNLGRRKTIILIAHRLTTVRTCDRIFLLEHGQLLGSGTFDSLFEQYPKFRAMTVGGDCVPSV